MILFLLQPLKINSILSASPTTNLVHHFMGLIDPDSAAYRLLWALKTQCSPEPLPWGHAKQAPYLASASLIMQATPHPRRPLIIITFKDFFLLATSLNPPFQLLHHLLHQLLPILPSFLFPTIILHNLNVHQNCHELYLLLSHVQALPIPIPTRLHLYVPIAVALTLQLVKPLHRIIIYNAHIHVNCNIPHFLRIILHNSLTGHALVPSTVPYLKPSNKPILGAITYFRRKLFMLLFMILFLLSLSLILGLISPLSSPLG